MKSLEWVIISYSLILWIGRISPEWCRLRYHQLLMVTIYSIWIDLVTSILYFLKLTQCFFCNSDKAVETEGTLWLLWLLARSLDFYWLVSYWVRQQMHQECFLGSLSLIPLDPETHITTLLTWKPKFVLCFFFFVIIFH